MPLQLCCMVVRIDIKEERIGQVVARNGITDSLRF